MTHPHKYNAGGYCFVEVDGRACARRRQETKKQWLVHSYHNQSQFVTHAKAKRLLNKHGGSYDWIENVCHVYILPVTTTSFEQRGQEDLSHLRIQ